MVHTGTTWFSDTLGRWLNHAPLTDIEGVYAALPDALRTVAALKEERYADVFDTFEGRTELGIIIGWSEQQKRCVGFRFTVDGTDVAMEWLKPGFIWQPGFPDEDKVPSSAKVPDIIIKVAEAVAPIANAENSWSGIGGELVHVHIQRGGIRISPVRPMYNHAEIKEAFANDQEHFLSICEGHLFA